MSLSNKFAASDSALEELKQISDNVQFYGHKVKNFNEEELRIAIGYLAKTLQYEQKRMLNNFIFSRTTLDIINYNPTIKEIR